MNAAHSKENRQTAGISDPEEVECISLEGIFVKGSLFDE
jgi:hypothetical protein